MSLRNKSRQISLASLFICFFIPQVQAGFLDDAFNKAKNATKKVVNDTVDTIAGEKEEQKTTDKSKQTIDKTVQKSKTVSQEKSIAKSAQVTSTKKPPDIITYQTGTPNGDLDIIGLRLGMSLSQAEAVLRAHKDGYKIIYTKAHLIGDFRLPENGKRASNKIPGTDYIKSIAATNMVKLQGTHLILYFSPPPSVNKLMYIKKVTEFGQSGPTIEAYNKAFLKKYGDKFYSSNAAYKIKAEEDKARLKGLGMEMPMPMPASQMSSDTKVIRLNSGKKFTDIENYRCYQSIGRSVLNSLRMSNGHLINVNEKCGLILASAHRGNGAGILSHYETTLLDFGEWVKYHDKKVELIQDNNNQIKQEKLKAASERDSNLF